MSRCHTGRGRPFGQGMGLAGETSPHAPTEVSGSDVGALVVGREIAGPGTPGGSALAVHAATPMLRTTAAGRNTRCAKVNIVGPPESGRRDRFTAGQAGHLLRVGQ